MSHKKSDFEETRKSLFGNLLCRVGLHKFTITREGGIRGFAHWFRVKECQRCGKEVKQ